jgi:hypothetical protein
MYVPTGKDIKGSAEKREIRRKKSLSPELVFTVRFCVVMVLVLSSCYSQSRLSIGFLCCSSFLTPEAFFLGGGGFVFLFAADVLCFFTL